MKSFRDTILGKICIEEENGFITRLSFLPKDFSAPPEQESKTMEKAFKELCQYLEGKRRKFTVPINPKGTPFQKSVWENLLKIPYGKTATYKDIAIACGNSKAVRAVGMANNKNPIAIIIPCHRVIGSNGKLYGYASGTQIKEALLKIEKVQF
ncbi:MAG: methylated-DNA--[protein]-cysteine S-methyltransferase [Opitutales bacterium]|nr:methylated-DNA--[protein]-cysteine S-methyltransferase [Opitutales bacterium]